MKFEPVGILIPLPLETLSKVQTISSSSQRGYYDSILTATCQSFQGFNLEICRQRHSFRAYYNMGSQHSFITKESWAAITEIFPVTAKGT